MGEQRLWTTSETAAYLGVPVKTLYQWNSQGTGPPAFRVGRYLRYSPARVAAWLDSRNTRDRRRGQ